MASDMPGVMVGQNICLLPTDSGDRSVIDAVLETWKPEKVALAFCPKREEIVLDSDGFGSKKLIDYLREKGGFFSLISQMFYFSIYSSIQVHDSAAMQMTLAAKEEAEKRGVDVVYVYQDLDIMVKRAWKHVPLGEKLAFARLFKRELLSLERPREHSNGHPDVEMIEQIMDAAPSSRSALEKERFEHMALSVLEASADSKVMVVASSDILENITSDLNTRTVDVERRTSLEKAPSKFRIVWLRWILAGFLLSIFAYSLINGGWEQAIETIKWWFIATSVSAMIGATIARAHPYSIAAAFISAPFISFTFIGAGWVSGLVELRVREPTIGEITKLSNMSSWKELFTNRCTKPLAVGFITNGANWIGIIIVMPYLIRSIA